MSSGIQYESRLERNRRRSAGDKVVDALAAIAAAVIFNNDRGTVYLLYNISTSTVLHY